MFEIAASVLSAWRTILHVSEWTGLSVGALAGLAFLAWPSPAARTFAIRAALVIAAAYGGTTYGNHVGRADVMAQWEAAKAAAEQARKERDAAIAAELEQKYAPVITALQRDSDARQQLVETYAKK